MRSAASELDCLRALSGGLDCWRDFWGHFGGFICTEFGRLGISAGPERDDLYQDLAAKLIAHDFQVIRGFLEHDAGLPFVALLRAVIRSIIVDDWRRKKRWRQVRLDPQALDGVPGGGAGFADPAAALLRSTRLGCVFASLAVELKDRLAHEVLHLRYIEEVPVNTIASRLGLSPNAVSQRLRLYRRRLAEGYGPQLREMLDD